VDILVLALGTFFLSAPIALAMQSSHSSTQPGLGRHEMADDFATSHFSPLLVQDAPDRRHSPDMYLQPNSMLPELFAPLDSMMASAHPQAWLATSPPIQVTEMQQAAGLPMFNMSNGPVVIPTSDCSYLHESQWHDPLRATEVTRIPGVIMSHERLYDTNCTASHEGLYTLPQTQIAELCNNFFLRPRLLLHHL
jgi:hypothetical protein